MKKLSFAIVAVCAILFLLPACKQQKVYNFSCNVNGVAFKGDLVAQYNNNTLLHDTVIGSQVCILSVRAFDPYYQQGVVVLNMVQQVSGTGVYTLATGVYSDSTNALNPCDTVGCQSSSFSYNTNYLTGTTVYSTSGQINLTAFDATKKTFSANFSAVMSDGTVISGGSITNLSYAAY